VDTMEFGVLPDVLSPDDKFLVEFVFTAGAENGRAALTLGMN
jgi:hypothetical protein